MKQEVKKKKVLVSLSAPVLKKLDGLAKKESRTRSSALEMRLEQSFKRPSSKALS